MGDGKGGLFVSSQAAAVNTKIMIAAIIVLFLVVLFIVLLHIYARWFWRNARLRRGSWSRRFRRRRFRFNITAEVTPVHGSTVNTKGLDKSVIESLPIFHYKVNPGQQESELECSVCLSVFEENEAGRRLPKCNHVFHTDCIDMWFESHSTCPLCRASVVEDLQGGENVLREAVVTALNNNTPHNDVNEVAIQILQTEGSSLLLPSSSSAQQEQFPASVLFWGNQSYVGATVSSQGVTDVVSCSPRRNRNRRELVIDVPARGNISTVCSPRLASPSTSPLKSLRRILSREPRRFSETDDCQQAYSSPSHTPSSISTCHTPTSQC